jgi:hypothetical protein
LVVQMGFLAAAARHPRAGGLELKETTMSIRRKLLCLVAGAATSVALVVTGAGPVAAASGATCSGGPVAAGTYSALTITGLCQVAAGDVSVTGNLTVASGGVLLAAFSGSNLTVGGNLIGQSGAIVVLGCEPEAFPCFNGAGKTQHSVGGNLIGNGVVMMLAHASSIGGNVIQSGGPGVTCSIFPLGPDGPPAFSTYEDNVINGNATVTGLRTCWAGFFRNQVGGNVIWSNNVLADEDGNEIADNTIKGNLNCVANNPAVQFGDSAGTPNTVGGRTNGQCLAVV